MKRLILSLKKNQIVVFVIGLMIITAGYLSYSNNYNFEEASLADSEEIASIGDAQLVSANISSDENTIVEDTENDENSFENENIIESNEAEETSETETSETELVASSLEESSDDYFVSSRLERSTMYSQSIEAYQKILNNVNVSETQKKTAEEEIIKLNNEQNAIMIAENLIKAKGIEDLIIFVNSNSINVIVKGNELSKSEIAQIQNIITRELEADIADIHIMNKDE